MANDLSNYTVEIMANEGLLILEENMVMGNLVHRDWAEEVKKKGSTIDINRPGTFTAADKVDGNVVPQDLDSDQVQIVMNQEKDVTFAVTDVEHTQAFKNMIDEYMRPGMIAIADNIDSALTALYVNLTTEINVTSPSSVAHSDITAVNKAMNAAKVPKTQRRFVVGTEAEDDLLNIDNYLTVDKTGGTQALQDAALGRKVGFDFYMDQNIVSTGASPATEHNMAFHRNAFALAMRPLEVAHNPAKMGVDMKVVNYNNLGIRVSLGYSFLAKKTLCSLEVLYGVKTLDANLGVELNLQYS